MTEESQSKRSKRQLRREQSAGEPANEKPGKAVVDRGGPTAAEEAEDDVDEAEAAADATAGDEGEPGADDEAPARPLNRKERRARKARGEDDESEPVDRNKRLRDEAAARRAKRRDQEGPGLDAAEMVDDAFSRGWHVTWKFLVKYSMVIQSAVAAVVIVSLGWWVYGWYGNRVSDAASDSLGAGIRARLGYVVAEELPPELKLSPIPTFKTKADQRQSARTAFERTIKEHVGTGPALAARLALAGIDLEDGKLDEALQGYQAVKAAREAQYDQDATARATEGIGFVKEAKQDLEGALAAFRDLEATPGNKELAQYHEGRVLAELGKKDPKKLEEATKLLETLHKALSDARKFRESPGYVETRVFALRKRMDPSAKAPERKNDLKALLGSLKGAGSALPMALGSALEPSGSAPSPEAPSPAPSGSP